MKDGVLLLNLGGPETLSDVRPFLYKLFSNPEIIRIKKTALRRILAWFISRAREKKSQNLYRQIGGGSPLRKITESQAEALEKALAGGGNPSRVYVGMLCGKPSIDEAFDNITTDGVRRLTLLPLFPQYSGTTTGACIRYVRELAVRRNLSGKIEISCITDWHKNPLYIDAVTDAIMAALNRFPEDECADVHIIYSAHSLPERYIKQGDPYLYQTKECVSLINNRLQERLNYNVEYSIAFQSRVGPVKWLEPSTESVIGTLARRGVRNILAVPVSFVSDNIETLYELDIEYGNLAAELGVANFRRVESLNVHTKFIEVLTDITLACDKNTNWLGHGSMGVPTAYN